MTNTTKLTGLTHHQIAELDAMCARAGDVTYTFTASTFHCDLDATGLFRLTNEAFDGARNDRGRRQALASVRRNLARVLAANPTPGMIAAEADLQRAVDAAAQTIAQVTGSRAATVTDGGVTGHWHGNYEDEGTNAHVGRVAGVTAPAKPYTPESNVGALTTSTLGAGCKR